VSLNFSEAVDSQSVNAATVTLNNATGAQLISITVSGNSVVLTPAVKFLPAVQYTVHVSPTVRSSRGGALGSQLNFSFSTAGGWGTFTLAENLPSDAYAPKVEFHSNGNPIAVWNQSFDGVANFAAFHVFENQYAPGIGWGTAVRIDTDAGGSSGPSLVTNSSGDALVVWGQNGGVWGSTLVSGSWVTTQLASASYVNAQPKIAINESGDAVAVWTEAIDSSTSRIRAIRYTRSGGWESPQYLQTSVMDLTGYHTISIDKSGRAIAMWVEYDATSKNIKANYYTPSTGWGSESMVRSEPCNNCAHGYAGVDVQFGGDGVATAVWASDDLTISSASTDTAYVARYTIGSGWSAATPIGHSYLFENDGYPKMATGVDGSVMIVWSQYAPVGSGISDSVGYYVNYAPNTGWSAAQTIDLVNGIGTTDLKIAMDTGNNAWIVWRDSRTGSIAADRYVPGEGWGSGVLLESSAGYASDPDLAVDSDGTIEAIWIQQDQPVINGQITYSVYSNRFE
jgi:hypothetical protein